MFNKRNYTKLRVLKIDNTKLIILKIDSTQYVRAILIFN